MTSTDSRRRWVRLASAATVLFALAACGSASVDPGAVGTGDSGAYATSVLAAGSTNTKIHSFDTLAEAMPNHTYTRNGRSGRIADVVVRGRIVDVVEGRAYILGEDDETITEIPFDDKRAMWKTVHLQVAVDDLVAGKPVGKTIWAGITLRTMKADFGRLSESLIDLGDVLLPLRFGSPHFAYDKSVWAIADGGALLGVIGEDGSISLPFTESLETAKALLEGTPTFTSLKSAAAQAQSVHDASDVE